MNDLLNRMVSREESLCTHKYATRSNDVQKSKREKPLNNDQYRTEFQRDIHRIIYSQPFRRLRHKTQVFYFPSNDHICTRLEHALHVASCSRTVARALGLNEDLAEAIALGHDLGHPPFGHHGEIMLTEIRDKKYKEINQEPMCPFHHEVNSLRVVDRLAQWDRGEGSGLNLTWGVRDGIVSHNGEDFTKREIIPFSGQKNLTGIKVKLDAGNPYTLEGCVVRLCDKIAYIGRDIEDAIHAGLIKPSQIEPNVMSAFGLSSANFINGEITKILVTDVIDNSKVDENRICLSQKLFDALQGLHKFNTENIYRREELHMYKEDMDDTLEGLFELFYKIMANHAADDGSGKLDISVEFPPQFSVLHVFKKFVKELKYEKHEDKVQIVIDFLSGFTDNYVLKARAELLEPKPVA